MNNSKYQEAFIEMKNATLMPCPAFKITDNGCSCDNQSECKYKNAVETIQELVDKATPKKYAQKTEIVNGFELIHVICPNCKEVIDEFEYYKGCPCCLQAIDWSELIGSEEE